MVSRTGPACRSAIDIAHTSDRLPSDITPNRRNLPSCDQSVGYFASAVFRSVSTFVPAFAGLTAISLLPSWVRKYAMREPSGDQTGEPLWASPAVICVALPAWSIIQISAFLRSLPNLAATARVPSGEIRGGPHSPVLVTCTRGLPLRSTQES